MRRLFALAVVALHGLLILLLLSGVRLRPDAPRQVPSLVSIWITPLSPIPPAESPRAPEPESTPAAGRPQSLNLTPETSVPNEIEAGETQSAPASESAITPGVDWMREAELAARRAAAAPGKREGFSDPPKTLRKPCEPRKPSMEWNGPDERRVGMIGIFPYVAIGTCVFSIGFFACTLDPMPPNSHMLDDMKDRDRPRASVPHKDLCE